MSGVDHAAARVTAIRWVDRYGWSSECHNVGAAYLELRQLAQDFLDFVPPTGFVSDQESALRSALSPEEKK